MSVLVVVALALLPAAAFSATRYAEATGGGDVTGCPQTSPCTLTNAFAGDGGSNYPSGGDVIVAEPGTYSVSTNLEAGDGDLTLEGEPGEPRPIIDLSGSGEIESGAGTNLSYLEIEGTSDTGDLLNTYQSTLSQMLISSDLQGGIVCQCYNGTIANSVIVDTGTNGGAVGINSNGGSATESYYNDTFYATQSTSAPFLVTANGYSAGSAALAFTAQNVIFANGGGGNDIEMYDDGTGDEATSASLSVADSDYDPTKVLLSLTGGAIGGVTAGAGNISTPPAFVNAAAGDFHELASSPTIGTGTTDATHDGSIDFDGLSRSVAGLTDIGAFEYQSLGAASATASLSTAVTGASVTFTGTDTDPNPGAGPLTYSWSFDDGTSATGASVMHTFTTAGVHTATLTVSDGSPFTATASVSVTINAPTPALPPPPPLVSVISITSGSVTVSPSGAFSLPVDCGNATCTGSLALSVKVKKTTGKGKHRKTKTTTEIIGSVPLAALAVGRHTIHMTLNHAGRTLLKDDHGKLIAAATATYDAGTFSKKAIATLTLHAAKKPKKK